LLGTKKAGQKMYTHPLHAFIDFLLPTHNDTPKEIKPFRGLKWKKSNTTTLPSESKHLPTIEPTEEEKEKLHAFMHEFEQLEVLRMLNDGMLLEDIKNYRKFFALDIDLFGQQLQKQSNVQHNN
jgi:hypothetical protein